MTTIVRKQLVEDDDSTRTDKEGALKLHEEDRGLNTCGKWPRRGRWRAIPFASRS